MTDDSDEELAAQPAVEPGPELDLNVNGGDPISPEPTDDPEED